MRRKIPPSGVGILAPAVWSNLGHLLGIWSSDWMIAVIILIYFGIGYWTWCGSFRTSVGPMLLVYLATPVGIMASVQIDRLVWNYDRGVWLIEIFVVLALALVPLTLGAVVAKIWQGSRWSHTQARE